MEKTDFVAPSRPGGSTNDVEGRCKAGDQFVRIDSRTRGDSTVRLRCGGGSGLVPWPAAPEPAPEPAEVLAARQQRIGDETQVRGAEEVDPLRQLVPQVAFGVFETSYGISPGLLVSGQPDENVGAAGIRRQDDFGDFDLSQPGIGRFKPDQFAQLLPHCFGDAPCP